MEEDLHEETLYEIVNRTINAVCYRFNEGKKRLCEMAILKSLIEDDRLSDEQRNEFGKELLLQISEL